MISSQKSNEQMIPSSNKCPNVSSKSTKLSFRKVTNIDTQLILSKKNPDQITPPKDQLTDLNHPEPPPNSKSDQLSNLLLPEKASNPTTDSVPDTPNETNNESLFKNDGNNKLAGKKFIAESQDQLTDPTKHNIVLTTAKDEETKKPNPVLSFTNATTNHTSFNIEEKPSSPDFVQLTEQHESNVKSSVASEHCTDLVLCALIKN